MNSGLKTLKSLSPGVTFSFLAALSKIFRRDLYAISVHRQDLLTLGQQGGLELLALPLHHWAACAKAVVYKLGSLGHRPP